MRSRIARLRWRVRADARIGQGDGQCVTKGTSRPHKAAVRDLLGVVAFSCAFYFAYTYAMAFSQRSAAPFWFPDSVLLCTLLVTPPSRWVLYLYATLPIRVLSDVAADVPLWFLLAATTIDAVKGVLSALALRRFLPNPLRFETIAQFTAFCLWAVMLVPALGAFGGAAARCALGYDYWSSWSQWFLGDVLAQLVVTPALFYMVFDAGRMLRSTRPKPLLEGALLTAALVASAYLAANAGGDSRQLLQAQLYAPVPFMCWAAVRFGMFGASGAISILSIAATCAALQRHGLFADRTPLATAAALQNFLLLRAVPLYLIAIAVDQHRRSEHRLRESEERFRNLANTAPVFMWLCDSEQHLEFVNDSWQAFTGRGPRQELADGWLEGVHPEDRKAVVAAFRACFEARAGYEQEYRQRRRDGEYRWILTTGVPRYAPDGRFLGYVGSAIDISDRKRAEEATHALAHAQRLASIGELTALIAHEIRQPLCAMLANANTMRRLLRRSPPPLEELLELVERIRLDDLRAEATVKRIRAFARNHAPSLQVLDVNLLIGEVLRLLAGDANRRGVVIRRQLGPGIPHVQGDATQLQQVLVNLVVNAIEAVGRVSSGERQVTVATDVHGSGSVEVTVRDTGPGVPPDELPKVFDSFFTTRPDGVGLGLAIAHSIVSAHHGEVFAHNNPEGGATFGFTLPLVMRESASRIAVAPSVVRPPGLLDTGLRRPGLPEE